MADTPTPTQLRTYKDWRRKGRQVNKGEHACEFNAQHEALFSKDQTREQRSSDPGDFDYDYLEDFGLFHD